MASTGRLMELRQLTYLVAVADHGTFTAAARASHVAQPSLSQAIRVLEGELPQLHHAPGAGHRSIAAAYG